MTISHEHNKPEVSVRWHLKAVHGVDPGKANNADAAKMHDRLHEETKAADEKTAAEVIQNASDIDVDPKAAVQAANRITRFIAVRDTMKSLDPEELSGVYLGPNLIPLKRADVMTLCRFAYDVQARTDQ